MHSYSCLVKKKKEHNVFYSTKALDLNKVLAGRMTQKLEAKKKNGAHNDETKQ